MQCQDCGDWSHHSCSNHCRWCTVPMLFLCYVLTDLHARHFCQPNSCRTAVEDQQNAMKYVRKICGLRKSIHVRQMEKHTIACCANAKKWNLVREEKEKTSGGSQCLVRKRFWRNYRRKHDFWKIKKVYTVSLGRDPGQLKKQKMQKWDHIYLYLWRVYFPWRGLQGRIQFIYV